jgi:hypothetical protein
MVSPVVFPLDFDGPVTAQGNGGVNFKGTVTFPQISRCLISGILSALVSGSGQSCTFSVSPPAAVANRSACAEYGHADRWAKKP